MSRAIKTVESLECGRLFPGGRAGQRASTRQLDPDQRAKVALLRGVHATLQAKATERRARADKSLGSTHDRFAGEATGLKDAADTVSELIERILAGAR